MGRAWEGNRVPTLRPPRNHPRFNTSAPNLTLQSSLRAEITAFARATPWALLPLLSTQTPPLPSSVLPYSSLAKWLQCTGILLRRRSSGNPAQADGKRSNLIPPWGVRVRHRAQDGHSSCDPNQAMGNTPCPVRVSVRDRWLHGSTRRLTRARRTTVRVQTQTRGSKSHFTTPVLTRPLRSWTMPRSAETALGADDDVAAFPRLSQPARWRWVMERTHAAPPSAIQGLRAWTHPGARHPTCPPSILTKRSGPSGPPVNSPRSTAGSQ
ncbi:hypothetical protein BD309DRAFT_956562 [Dichomitus squalens]|nr:hypothetical protein BD309DRAFT_956562 [Dichomitus squalens]